MVSITEGIVDYLRVYSVCVELPKSSYGRYTIIITLANVLLGYPTVYGIADLYPDGTLMCRSESDHIITSFARKKIRKKISELALPLIDKLRNA